MSTISHREMRNNSAEILRRVKDGEAFTVTNRGKPVAEIVPVTRSVLDELEAHGQVRHALHGPEVLGRITRVDLCDGETTAQLIADVRGYDRGY